MIKAAMIFRIGLMTIVSLSSLPCKAGHKKPIDKDTIVLARSTQGFTIDSTQPFYQVNIQPDEKLFFDPAKKTLLIFDAPVVTLNPDGVYEIYITRDKSELKSFQPGLPGFVNLMDIYALTVPEPPSLLSADISWHLEGVKKNEPLPPFVVSILFRGALLSGTRETKQAGIMTVKGIRIVQEK